ncbi:unnamed protein product [Gordionus sp. m RMFG-2023]|uniref:protein Dr1-like n=1 Tax=Gordionus sp. m RMFG-2023 TaxID=3053472 RepID=UPI0030E02B25
MADKEDDEPTIPRAILNKIFKETIPSVRVASETRELILNCCSDFIRFISTEAYKICNESDKKTIVPEHILTALQNLGFHDFVPDANIVLNDCKDRMAKRKRKSHRLENLGIPEEELLRQQEELFAKARLEQATVEHKQWLQLQENSMLHLNSHFASYKDIMGLKSYADEPDSDYD